MDEELYIDKSPEKAKFLKDWLTISDDYFIEIAEDPKPKEIEAKLSQLKGLCQFICK